MNRKVLQYIIPLILLTFMCLFEADAQPPPPGGSGPPCWPPPCVPIDGGISLLVAAGAAYGAKKTMDLQKNKRDTSDL